MSTLQDKTPLTEQQARSLAHWWGGEYRESCLAADGRKFAYGVIVHSTVCPDSPAVDAPVPVCSLEEAREMENRRGFQDACTPDWVG